MKACKTPEKVSADGRKAMDTGSSSSFMAKCQALILARGNAWRVPAGRARKAAPLHGQRLAGLGLAAIGENPHPQIQNAPRFCARLIERKSDMAKRGRAEVQRQQIGFMYHFCGDGHKQLRKCVL